MNLKAIVGKIGSFFKKVGKGIWVGIKWIGHRFAQWFRRTKHNVSRVYLVWACFISGIIGFGKSVKSQYHIWKSDRKAWLHPEPEAEFIEEVSEN